MYIPVSFFGGACSSATGSTYTYYNRTSATTDLFTFPQLCNSASITSVNLPASQSLQLCTSGVPSGVNATTVEVDSNFNVTGSCGLLYPNLYTITVNGQASIQYTPLYNTDSFKIETGLRAPGTHTIVSYSTPKVFRTASGFTIVNNGVYTAEPYPNIYTTFKNNPYKTVTLESTGGGTGTTSVRYLGPAGDLNEVTIPQNLRYEVVTSTIPQIYATGSGGSITFMTDLFGREVASSSCYNYGCYNSAATTETLNYVDCTNTSASVTILSGGTTSICAKVNSIILPLTYSGIISVDSPCS
jgi:hypothetical protein